jgi:hypothetical protein
LQCCPQEPPSSLLCLAQPAASTQQQQIPFDSQHCPMHTTLLANVCQKVCAHAHYPGAAAHHKDCADYKSHCAESTFCSQRRSKMQPGDQHCSILLLCMPLAIVGPILSQENVSRGPAWQGLPAQLPYCRRWSDPAVQQ